MDVTVAVDNRVGPLGYVVVVLRVARLFPHLQHGAASYPLGIAEKQTFAVVELPGLGETGHFRVSKPGAVLSFLSNRGAAHSPTSHKEQPYKFISLHRINFISLLWYRNQGKGYFSFIVCNNRTKKMIFFVK